MAFPKSKMFMSIVTTILASCYEILGNTTNLISSTCETTLYVELCESSLRSDLRSKAADLGGLVTISLNQTIAKSVKNLAYINNLRSHFASSYVPQVRATIKSLLGDCEYVYSDAIESLKESFRALNDDSYDTMRSLVSAAMTDLDTCEDGFSKIEGSSSPSAEQN